MQDEAIVTPTSHKRVPWNKGKLTGAKPPLRPKHVWAIRTKLQIEGRVRDLAMFNLAIDSKLRGCDVVAIRSRMSPPAAIRRIAQRFDKRKPVGPKWVGSAGLDSRLFGTHSLRRTKSTVIYRRTGNLRAVQLLLGHTKIESTVRYLGIEVDDALAIAEQVDV